MAGWRLPSPFPSFCGSWFLRPLLPLSRSPGQGRGACLRGGAACRGEIKIKTKQLAFSDSIGSSTALLCIYPPSNCLGLLGLSRVLQPPGYGALVRGGSSEIRGPDPGAGSRLPAEQRRRYLGWSRSYRHCGQRPEASASPGPREKRARHFYFG